MNEELIQSQDDSEGEFTLIDFPVEVLFYIISYLSTRDKVQMRYVCQRFHQIMETPLLWKEFIWFDWEPRHVCGVTNVLKGCGEHVRQIFFPDHATPTEILEMVPYCTKVTYLSFPLGTQLNLVHLEEILHVMTHLQTLDVFASGIYIKNFLEVTAVKVRELKLRIRGYDAILTLKNLKSWVNEGNTLPPTINILTDITDRLVYKLFKFWSESNSKLLSFKIGLYDSAKVPLNLYPSVPLIKLQFGAGTTLPFVNLSSHGILELEEEAVFVNDYDHCGKSRCTLAIGFVDLFHKFEGRHLQFSISNLYSVTCIDFTNAEMYSNHLEQLAVACPNLQRLNLKYVNNCLKNLQGLYAIVQACQNLQGLNLTGISVYQIESYLLLWEFLSSVKKLTHLAVELCTLIPGDCDDNDKQKLIGMLRSCNSLQALEIYHTFCPDCPIEDAYAEKDFLFSNFPSLLYVRLILTDNTSALKYAVTNCHQFKYLCYENDFIDNGSLPLSMSCHLQQLCIQLQSTDMSTPFVDVLSAHGELERVVLLLHSVTTNAITILIRNSPNLVLLYIVIEQQLCDEDGYTVRRRCFMRATSETFTDHKLLSSGNFNLLQDKDSTYRDEILGIFTTDLGSLWPLVDSYYQSYICTSLNTMYCGGEPELNS